MLASVISQSKHALQLQVNEFLDEHADMSFWAHELLDLVLEGGHAAELGSLDEVIRVKPRRVEHLLVRLAGYPPYRPWVEQKIRKLNLLASRWHAAGLAYVPGLVPPQKITRSYCTRFRAQDESTVQSFRALWKFFLFNRLSPDLVPTFKVKSRLDEEDHRACSVLFVLLATGDLLTSNLAKAVADFNCNHLDSREPWSISTWFGLQQRRWPVSWVSALYLLRLWILVNNGTDKRDYFFSSRYFNLTNRSDSGSPLPRDESRVPRYDGNGHTILHRTFNHWLAWLTHAARCAGTPVDSRLSLRSAVQAARILAAFSQPPAVVSYLSGYMPSPPLNDPSWLSLLAGAQNKSPIHKPPKVIARKKPPPVKEYEFELNPDDWKGADEAVHEVRSLIGLLASKSRIPERQKLAVRIEAIANRFPRVPARSGREAWLGHLAAAILYIGNRLRVGKARGTTLESEFARTVDVACGLMGGDSLATLTREELTALAINYVRGYETPHSQKGARSFLKRFFQFLVDDKNNIFERECALPQVDWSDPDLRIKWTMRARQILVPGQMDEIISLAKSDKEKQAFVILAALGLYCGLRESEALALTAGDLTKTITLELKVPLSKTPAGLRRLPLDVLIPQPMRTLVLRHLNGLLDGDPNQNIVDDGEKHLYRLELLMAKHYGASYHVLRHSAASLMVVRLFLAYNHLGPELFSQGIDGIRANLENLHGEMFSREALLEFAQGLLGPGWRNNRPSIIPVVSKLLGHVEPTVTVNVYLHCLDFIAVATRELFKYPRLSGEQAAAMREVSRQTIINRLGNNGGKGYDARELVLDWAKQLGLLDKSCLKPLD